MICALTHILFCLVSEVSIDSWFQVQVKVCVMWFSENDNLYVKYLYTEFLNGIFTSIWKTQLYFHIRLIKTLRNIESCNCRLLFFTLTTTLICWRRVRSNINGLRIFKKMLIIKKLYSPKFITGLIFFSLLTQILRDFFLNRDILIT